MDFTTSPVYDHSFSVLPLQEYREEDEKRIKIIILKSANQNRMIRELALKIGAYFDQHWCKYCFMRLLVVLTSLFLFAYELYQAVFSRHHENYYIYADHYIIRKQQSEFRGISHMNSCCEYFQRLDQTDLHEINNPSIYSKLVVYFLLFFGSVVCSIWGNLVSLMGRYDLLVAVTVSGMLVGQFNLFSSLVNYGNQCIECSHLNLLPIKLAFFPYIGFVLLIISLILVYFFFKCKKFKQSGFAYCIWCFGAFIAIMAWAWINFLVIINSIFGILILFNIIADLICFAIAYYEYEQQKLQGNDEKEKEKKCCGKHLFDWTSPFSKKKEMQEQENHDDDAKREGEEVQKGEQVQKGEGVKKEEEEMMGQKQKLNE